jgi:hypothetical protein
MKESQIQTRILLALSEAGCTVWRCETAGAWVGRVIHQSGGTVTLADARMIQAGLTKGGADIIGISPDGRFIGVEVKTKTGRVSQEQDRFISAVRAAGGIAGVARSVEDALKLIR